MQDRFKFRAWDKKHGIMVYCEEEASRKQIKEYEALYDLDEYYFCREVAILSCLYDINDDFIFEQCTGTKDKNGKLVYEGDVIKTPNGSIGYIVWSQQNLGFSTKDLNPKEKEVYLFECEVIGNIHEYAEREVLL